jgi:hypothetical protein
VFAVVDNQRPNAWREEPGDSMIKRLVDDGYSVIVKLGTAEIPILAQGMDPVLLSAWVTHAKNRVDDKEGD